MDHQDASPNAAAVAPRLPWDIHPALTEDRLRICGRLLANARRDALAMASYEMGDDPWSVGCRAYAFSRHRLARAASSGTYNWLSTLDESHHFVFLIEDVPVRFYRGLAEEPNAKTLRRHEDETEQLSLALGDEGGDGPVFRFAVETGEGGRVARVVFLALRGEEGQAECFWPVPLEVAAEPGKPFASQLRLIPDDGYGGPEAATQSPKVPAVPPRARRAAPRQAAGRKPALF